jgi:hypothetical protein
MVLTVRAWQRRELAPPWRISGAALARSAQVSRASA